MTGTVLIIGGGTAGNALAVLLRGRGIAVDLVERTRDWHAHSGAGITLQGNALRVLREIGIWDEVRAHGYAFDTVGILARDGTVLQVAEDLRTGGRDLPATVGMQRPVLQRMLSGAVESSGARVRLGRTVISLDDDGTRVRATLDDGSAGTYDLVVAADGVGSATRGLIGIDARPEPTGMGIWRAQTPRPHGVQRTEMVYGGPCYIAGYCPTGQDSLYAYLVEDGRDRDAIDPAGKAAEMRRLAAAYGGAWEEIRDNIVDPDLVNYTWFDRMLVEPHWHRGRVVLAGDAAHCCPPTLAQGAAMSLEDVLVLAELLARGKAWDDALLTEYAQRRLARVSPVVESSVRIGEWLLTGEPNAGIPALMEHTMTALAEQP